MQINCAYETQQHTIIYTELCIHRWGICELQYLCKLTVKQKHKSQKDDEKSAYSDKIAN